MTINDQYQKWQENTLKKSLDRFKERKERFETSSGIEVPRIALPSQPDPDYEAKLNFPGQYPFTRGVQPTMYRSRFWTMRQYAGFSTAEDSNRRYRYLLQNGQTGLSVAFDLPTQIGYDADDPIAMGEVGKVGVSISSIRDMEQLFDQIPLDKVSTSMTINAPAGVLLAMYIAVAKRQGVEMKQLRGTIQNDILKEYVARGTYIFPPAPSMRLITDIFSFCAQERAKLEHDLDLGLSHPGSGLDLCAGSGLHAGERHRLCRSGAGCGLERRRVRRSAFVLLQRAQQLFGRGGQIPRGAQACGQRSCASASRHRNPPPGSCVSIPRPPARRLPLNSRRTTWCV